MALRCLMRRTIFSYTRKTNMGSVVTCRKLIDMSLAMTRSTGAPPSATTTPLYAGSVDERKSGPPPRKGMIRSCGNTSERVRRLRFDEKVLTEHYRERSELAVRPRAGQWLRTRCSPGVPRPGQVQRSGGFCGRSRPSVGWPPRISQKFESVGAGGTRLGGLLLGPGLSAETRWRPRCRARRFAARRNSCSALFMSGSAICAPRRNTFTCSVASLMVVVSSMVILGLPGAVRRRNRLILGSDEIGVRRQRTVERQECRGHARAAALLLDHPVGPGPLLFGPRHLWIAVGHSIPRLQ